MKFRRLQIENFGIHRDRNWSLEEGVQVVYGPNETGKSTLLNLLRELLFKFSPRSEYLACSANKPLAARVAFELSDGRAGWFRRQKGRPDAVAGELSAGRAIPDQAALDLLFGGISQPLYERIFAFSHEELRQGAEGLKTAQLEEALFGGGIGGLGKFQQVEARLQERLAERFNPRGQAKKAAINKLLTDLQAAGDRYRKSHLRPYDYDVLMERSRSCAADATRLADELETLRGERIRVERLRKALPEWIKLQGLQVERDQSPANPALNRSLAREYRNLTAPCAQLSAEIQTLQERLQRRVRVPSIDTLEAAVLAAADQVTRLQRELSRMEQLRDALPLSRREQARLQAEVDQLHAEWGGGAPPAVTIQQRESTQQLARESGPLKERIADLKGRRGNLDRLIDRRRREFEELGLYVDPQPWDDLVERARRHRTHLQQFDELRKEQQAARAAAARLLAELSAALSGACDLEQPLLPPLQATVDEFRSQWRRTGDESTRIRDRQREAQDALEKSRSALGAWERTGAGDDRVKAMQLRARRDEGWSLVRRRYIDGLDPAADADLQRKLAAWTAGRPELLALQFEGALAAADEQSDRALLNAEWLARREQLSLEVRRCEERAAALAVEVAAAEQACRELETDWRSRWTASGIVPLPPSEMTEWLARYAELERNQRTEVEIAGKLGTTASLIASFERDLASALPDAPTDADGALRALEACAREIHRTEETRARLEGEIGELQLESEDLAAHEREQSRERQEWRSRLESILAELQLPRDWELDALLGVRERLEQVRDARRGLEQLNREVQESQAALDRFRDEVDAAARSVGLDLLGLDPSGADPVSAAMELAARLQAAREHRNRLAEDAAEIAGDERALADRLEQRGAIEARLAELVAQIGVPGSEGLAAAVDDFEHRDRCEGEISSLEQTLRLLLGPEWSAETDELRHLDQVDLEQRLEGADARLKSLSQSYQVAVEARGRAETELRALADETSSLTLGAELESLRAQLVEQVAQWAPLALTQALMQRALKRFEQEHQPRLLSEIARLFQHMTDGEHVSIRRQVRSGSEGGELTIVDRHGVERSPKQLSDGARSQLYLAIRLAFVMDYCRANEPLPVVMDDVLVHFDEDRARRTLQVLQEEAAQSTQVLLLTCHKRTAELWREVHPAGELLELAPASDGGQRGAEISSGEADDAPAEKPRRRRKSAEPPGSLLFPPK